METTYLTDITGTIGEWLDGSFGDEVSGEIVDSLAKTYELAAQELQKSDTHKSACGEEWDKEEVWAAIRELSSIRGRYNLFSKRQRKKYHACSVAIRALREVVGDPIHFHDECCQK